MLHCLAVAEKAFEGDGFLDTKRGCELLEALSLGTITDNDEGGGMIAQQRCGSTQGQVTGLPANQPTDED